MKRLFLALIYLAIPALVHAQTITSYTFRVYNQGASAPVQTSVFQIANVQCNQPAVTPPTGTVSNPNRVAWNDPVNAGKACIWNDPGTGVLFSLPFGAQVYEATIVATNGAGTSPESARSNLFTRPGLPPAVLTGVLVAP